MKVWQVDDQGCWQEMEFHFKAPEFEIASGIIFDPL